MRTYSELDPGSVCSTITVLACRIQERFPESGLSKVAAELGSVAEHNQLVIEHLRRPLWWVRALAALTIGALVALVLWATFQLANLAGTGGVADTIQALDAGTNEVIVLSLAVFFFFKLEGRIKRRSALRTLHRLRSIAHVVDMHQLTKDPENVLRPLEKTASSPVRTLSRPHLVRYLDYCSELFALTSKLAALHAQHLQDPVVLDAVNDIESLTADLSRNVWQKITILDMAGSQATALHKPPLTGDHLSKPSTIARPNI